MNKITRHSIYLPRFTRSFAIRYPNLVRVWYFFPIIALGFLIFGVVNDDLEGEYASVYSIVTFALCCVSLVLKIWVQFYANKTRINHKLLFIVYLLIGAGFLSSNIFYIIHTGHNTYISEAFIFASGVLETMVIGYAGYAYFRFIQPTQDI